MGCGATTEVAGTKRMDDAGGETSTAPMVNRATVHGEDREEMGKNGELTGMVAVQVVKATGAGG